jgi:hypothetical protein
MKKHIQPEPYNAALHEQLLALGFERVWHDAEWEDTGDAESGPALDGHPAWDEYTSASEIICIDEAGRVVHREERDLELERWCEEQARASGGSL